MSKFQKVILICGLAATAGLALFPPWLQTAYLTGTRDTQGFRSEKSAGHHFILSPPRPEQDAPIFGTKIDLSALGIEWIAVAAITGAAFVASRLFAKPTATTSP